MDQPNLPSLLNKINNFTKIAMLEKNDFKILFTEYGARVLGVFKNNETNFLWVSPNIEDVMKGGEWNIGGLRIWISPERNFYYKDPINFREWFCPKELDPNDFKIFEKNYNKVVFTGSFKLHDYINGEDLRGLIKREIKIISCRENTIKLSIIDSIITNIIKTNINLWSLTQVNPEGSVIIPVTEKAEPIHYFGPIPNERIRVIDNQIIFKIDGKYICKLGVRPEDFLHKGIARICYLHRVGDKWRYILKETFDAPVSQEECLDIPKYMPEGFRGAIQSYNSDTSLSFGEIELQFHPAIPIGNNFISVVKYTIEFFEGGLEECINNLKLRLGLKNIHLL